MPAKAKDYLNCTHCGRSDATGTEEPGFKIVITANAGRYIPCPCGMITKLCQTAEELKVVWNSRPSKPYVPPVISVKSPKTTKVDPSLLSTGANKTETPDEF